jgi:hypothetical protein
MPYFPGIRPHAPIRRRIVAACLVFLSERAYSEFELIGFEMVQGSHAPYSPVPARQLAGM